MSQIKVDTITDELGTGAPDFPNGIAVAGAGLAGLASQAEAEAGTDNSKVMTPLRVRNAFNATGTAPVFACRAFVNFNGTGTVAIRASGNVSSITDNGVGQYTINFTTAMQDANYCWTGACNSNTTAVDNRSVVGAKSNGVKTASELQILTTIGTSNTFNADVTDVCVAVFR